MSALRVPAFLRQAHCTLIEFATWQIADECMAYTLKDISKAHFTAKSINIISFWNIFTKCMSYMSRKLVLVVSYAYCSHMQPI